jgi:hypothetical protein
MGVPLSTLRLRQLEPKAVANIRGYTSSTRLRLASEGFVSLMLRAVQAVDFRHLCGIGSRWSVCKAIGAAAVIAAKTVCPVRSAAGMAI